MNRALVVGADDARGILAALRSLAANGWRVGAVTPTKRSLAASSRWCAAWHPLGDDVVASIPEGYDVVLPGGDADLFALSERRDEVPCAVPYGTRESVRTILDKVALSALAEEHGLRVPRTVEATDEAVAASRGTVVVKSRSHGSARAATYVTDDPAAAVAQVRAAGGEPVIQEHVRGALLALSVVVAQGEVVAVVQQRSSGLWPAAAGVSVRAETVPVDGALSRALGSFLGSIGWSGLAQAQFLDAPDGPRLIDVNGRCYGSLALASAAGVDLAHVWASAALGRRVATGPAMPGVRYQWLYGDVRRCWPNIASPMRWAAGAAHSVWSARDPKPAVAYLTSLAAKL